MNARESEMARALLVWGLALATVAWGQPVLWCEEVVCEGEVQVRVRNERVLTEEICIQISDSVGCEDVTYMPEQEHPCEDSPELTGCRHYQIEPASGDK